tara:strand:- start:25598 stop:26002 length:405 start_codon:yes stop_codon:yes gene_type:complete
MKIICDLNEDVTTYQYTEDEDGNRTDILDENGNKIIDNVKKKKNTVIYLFEDDLNILFNENNLVINSHLEDGDYHKIFDQTTTTNNAVLYEAIDYPEDEWLPRKYIYTSDNGFILNDTWVDPRTIEKPTSPSEE